MTTTTTIALGSWWFGRRRQAWPTATAEQVAVGDRLTLLAHPDGPRSLRSADRTLGGLVLPPTLATDGRTVWLLDQVDVVLRRFDPATDRFLKVPGWGGDSSGAHRFGPRTVLAAIAGHLALADPDRPGLVVVSTAAMTVRAVLDLRERRPVAVCGHAERFSVLDDRGDVRVTNARLDRLDLLPRPKWRPAGVWSRLAVDDAGRALLVDPDASLITGPDASAVHTADEVRDRFAAPPLSVERAGRFRVPARFRIAGRDASQWFDARGRPTRTSQAEQYGEPPYRRSGSWSAEPLDGGAPGCQWRRLTVTAHIPAGCTLTVETYTSDEAFAPAEIPAEAWSRPHELDADTEGDAGRTSDFAVLSPRGRFLGLRIGLRGDGWSTPSADELLVEPEGRGLENLLPAVYRGDDPDADFLRRFLAVFAFELDAVEQNLRTLPARFSPRAVPEQWLDVLAAELGVPLEREWEAGRRRQLLEVAPGLYRERGTPAALRAMLHAHLRAASDRELPPYLPALVEGFRERPGALLGRMHLPLPAGVRMWSDGVVDRPVLGSPGRREPIRLVSVGDRPTDRFRVHAHRFKVVVPSPLLPDDTARERFQRLIAAEKPAHVAHELVLVEPRAVVGAQGLLGVDTIVGAWPDARLVRSGCAGPVLGLGLRLAARTPAARPPAVGRGARAGLSTVLL
ncbi:phage tail protein [Streptomyces canus]|uniref:phage tail protein n=1 Tax=Streptomyces canus TaxID=58343 RepID=UPI00369BF3FF